MKSTAWHLYLLPLIAIVIACFGSATAADTIDDERACDRQRLQLLDLEKQLLSEEDRLKEDVDRLKQEIAARRDRIDIAQRRLDRINHELITLHMKLLP